MIGGRLLGLFKLPWNGACCPRSACAGNNPGIRLLAGLRNVRPVHGELGIKIGLKKERREMGQLKTGRNAGFTRIQRSSFPIRPKPQKARAVNWASDLSSVW